MTVITAYQVAAALAAAAARHPGLDWVTVPELPRPYVVDIIRKVVYLDGRLRPDRACEALLDGVDDLDTAASLDDGTVVALHPRRGHRRRGAG